MRGLLPHHARRATTGPEPNPNRNPHATPEHEACNNAIWAAFKAKPGHWLKDGVLVTDVDPQEWEVGYDAIGRLPCPP